MRLHESGRRALAKTKSHLLPVVVVDVDMQKLTTTLREQDYGNENRLERSYSSAQARSSQNLKGSNAMNGSPAMEDDEYLQFEDDCDDDTHDHEDDIVISDDVRLGEQASGFAGLSLSGYVRVYDLTVRLIEALSTSYLWIYRTILMSLFIIILLPGFIRVALWYTFSPKGTSHSLLL